MNTTIRIGRKRDQRNLLVRSLATALILYESMVTSPAKARMVQGIVDRLITIAKSDNKLTSRRRLLGYLLDKKAVSKVMDELTTRFTDRSSGFTRRLRLNSRLGDGGEQVIVQLVDMALLPKTTPTTSKTTKSDNPQGHNHEQSAK